MFVFQHSARARPQQRPGEGWLPVKPRHEVRVHGERVQPGRGPLRHRHRQGRPRVRLHLQPRVRQPRHQHQAVPRPRRSRHQEKQIRPVSLELHNIITNCYKNSIQFMVIYHSLKQSVRTLRYWIQNLFVSMK